MAPPSRFGDKAFEWLTLAMAMAVVALVFLDGWQLARGSSLAILTAGLIVIVVELPLLLAYSVARHEPEGVAAAGG